MDPPEGCESMLHVYGVVPPPATNVVVVLVSAVGPVGEIVSTGSTVIVALAVWPSESVTFTVSVAAVAPAM